jgi:Ca-activated chloride channel family protein
MNDIELENLLKNIKVPPANAKRRDENIAKAVSEFAQPHQGFGILHRLKIQLSEFLETRRIMIKKIFSLPTTLAGLVVCVFAMMFIIPQMNHEVLTPTVTPSNQQNETHPDSKKINPKPAPVSPMLKRELTEKAYTSQNFMGQRAESIGDYAPQERRMPQMEPRPLSPVYVGQDKFKNIEANPVQLVAEKPVSTFSIDVDTASYSFVRRQLNAGQLPQKDAVRVEELINYFEYAYPVPESREKPFSTTVAVYPTPWNAHTKLLHIGIKGYELPADQKPKSNLVFLIDTSGSMESADKLPLLKTSLRLLVEALNPQDTVALVAYAGSAGTVLEPTPVKEKHKILAALNKLQSGGSTAGGEGIELAYALAQQNFNARNVNRVILATDGDFNVGITNTSELKSFIERKRDSGIYLSVLGFGQGNYNDELMQTLAQNGNGNAAYIDNLNEARKVLVDEASSMLFPIANDVKIQIEFNPKFVSEYRLIGYETRLLKREDFNNDAVDAGEVGSGHTVTAIYEIAEPGSQGLMIEPSRYTKTEATKTNLDHAEIAFLKIRYKLPGQKTSQLIERPVTSADEYKTVAQAPNEMRFAAAVAAFGQLLTQGAYMKNFSYDDVLSLAQGSKGADSFNYRGEFVNLVKLAKGVR